MVWKCTIGLEIRFLSSLLSPFLPEFSGMNKCTIPLYTYEITKGFGGRKVLRKPYRSIKVSGFRKVLSFLPFPLATELRKNSGGLLCHL
jgi:hypothetical protein